MSKLKETMSEYVDGEASEIEVHRLLRELDNEQGLKKSFLSFQHIHNVVSSNESVALDLDQHAALFERISGAVQAEATHDAGTNVAIAWQKPAIGFAVAASLVVAVFMGVDYMETDSVSAVAENQDEAISTIMVAKQSRENQPELRELDEDKQQKLREYLNQHDRMTRLKRTDQTVNYQK